MSDHSHRWPDIFAGALLLLCLPLLLWQGSPVNQLDIPQTVFLSVHSLLEIVSIVLSGLIFFIAFGTRDTGHSIRVVLLGCFFLATALFDTIHTLAYVGMPDLISPNTPDKSISFWLAARISAGLGLLVYATWPHTRPVTAPWRFTMAAGTLALVALVAWVVFFHSSRLPAMYVPGAGLTSLKVALEWGVFGLYCLSAGLIYRRRNDVANFDARNLILALLILAAGELFLTMYVQVSSTANLLGHVYKLIGYGFLYRAIFAEAISQPFLHIEQLKNQVERERDFATGLVDTAPVIILLLDVRGMIQHANPYFEQLSGYPLDEIQGKEWFSSFIPVSDQARIRDLFFNSIHAQPTSGNVNAIVTRTGEERIIEWNNEVLRDADGSISALLAIGLDVTEQRHLEAELRQAYGENQAVTQAVRDNLYMLDTSGALIWWNRRLEEVTGLMPEALKGMPGINFFVTEDQAAVQEAIGKVFADGYGEVEARMITRNGPVFYHYNGVRVHDIHGQVIGIAGVGRDITERLQTLESLQYNERQLKELNETLETRVATRTAELIASRDEAERANAAKSEFLSRMSHELRTPLNAILGFGQLLATDQKPPLTAAQLDHLHEIRQAGGHLLELINEVLDLSRIESGHLDLKLEPVSVTLVIEACLAQIKPLAAQRNIRVALDLDAACVVLADRMRLKEIMLNLLSNAVKYNQEGGSIELSCASVQSGRVRINVRDSGRGIAADNLPRLFKPFERIESAYNGIEGTGIGLALAKKLVEGMNGEIGVDSVLDEGSTFWFELPQTTEIEAIAELAPGAGDMTVTSEHLHSVLYIEDNPANLRLVGKILATRQDIKLLDTDTAEAGLEIAVQQIPDLILLDLNLPGMNGFEALSRLRDNPITRHIPVIALTANAMVRDIELGLAAGFNDYITKPINVPGFLATIGQHLSISKVTPAA